MSSIQTTFKAGTTTSNTISLFINDVKTNIYYFTVPSAGKTVAQQQQEAFTMQRLIEQGAIYPEDGNWEGFDICDSSHFTIQELVILDFDPPYANKLLSARPGAKIGPADHQKIIASYLHKTEWTQYSKRLIQDRISDRVGIRFGSYGYGIYFI